MASKPRHGAPGGPPKTDDVVLIHGVTADGKGFEVLRKQGETVSAGSMRPLEEGKALTGDVVRLKPRRELPLLCDVEVEHRVEAPARETSGPAQVASEGYRSGWDSIWGKRRKQAATLN